MTVPTGPPPYAHDQEPCTGILLANLGTPEAPTPQAVRRYLREFLSDPRVVEIPRPLWWLILHGVILPLRPRRSARKYQAIWTESGSPLLAIARRQATAIGYQLEAACPGPVRVVIGMRYGNPSIAEALRQLREAGVRRLLIVPLYPQYSASTTASVFDAVAEELNTWRWLPELRMINHYHDQPGYIDAITQSILDFWSRHEPAERLLFSFHGTPKRSLLAGDPYHCECHKTARLAVEQLGLEAGEWGLAFQSRFGRAEWLKPYTSQLLATWAQQGIKSVDVICPGFSADCLETLEEIAMENREIFLKSGGGRYRYIPALNDTPRHMDALVELILAHGAGWPELTPGFDAAAAAEERNASLTRARALGAAQ